MAELILEDGTLSTPSANTYATASVVSAFCAARGLTFATGATAVGAILRAMAYIESFDFKGVKSEGPESNIVQPLKWPRSGAYDEDGYALDDDYIPPNLVNALSYAAYLEVQNVGVFGSALSSNIKREKVDVLETEYFTPSPSQKEYPVIMGYLKGLIKGAGGGMAKVLRV